MRSPVGTHRFDPTEFIVLESISYDATNTVIWDWRAKAIQSVEADGAIESAHCRCNAPLVLPCELVVFDLDLVSVCFKSFHDPSHWGLLLELACLGYEFDHVSTDVLFLRSKLWYSNGVEIIAYSNHTKYWAQKLPFFSWSSNKVEIWASSNHTKYWAWNSSPSSRLRVTSNRAVILASNNHIKYWAWNSPFFNWIPLTELRSRIPEIIQILSSKFPPLQWNVRSF